MKLKQHTTNPKTLEVSIERFLRIQECRNRSPRTLRAYRTNLFQLATGLLHESALLSDPADVTGDDLNEFLAHLAHHPRVFPLFEECWRDRSVACRWGRHAHA